MTTETTFLADLPALPRFAQTYCSQCGREFGPGNHGFSSCRSHAQARHATDDGHHDDRAWEEALAAANDPEYVARALVEGIKPGSAALVALILQRIREGRHDEADALSRQAERALANEYLVA